MTPKDEAFGEFDHDIGLIRFSEPSYFEIDIDELQAAVTSGRGLTMSAVLASNG